VKAHKARIINSKLRIWYKTASYLYSGTVTSKEERQVLVDDGKGLVKDKNKGKVSKSDTKISW
jgi:hypothetical protein